MSHIGTSLRSTWYLQNTVVSHIGKTFLFCDAHSVFLFVFGLDLNLLSDTWFKLVYGRFLNATALSNFASCFSYNTFNNRFHRKTINTMWLWSAMNDPPVNKDRISSSTPNLTVFINSVLTLGSAPRLIGGYYSHVGKQMLWFLNAFQTISFVSSLLPERHLTKDRFRQHLLSPSPLSSLTLQLEVWHSA